MSIRVTITKPNVFNEYGIAMTVGTTYTVDDAFGLSLITQQKASDTDASLVNPGVTAAGPVDVVYCNAATIAAPTAQMLASYNTVFALDVAPFTQYRTTGTALVVVPQYVTDASGNITGLANYRPSAQVVMPSRQLATIGAMLAAAPMTVIEQIPADDPFFGFRLMYLNYKTSPYTIDVVKAAAVDTALVDGAGYTHTAVTFAGSASVAVPAGTSATLNACIPGFVISDFIPITSVARVDFPARKPLIQVRTYMLSGWTNAITGGTGGTYELIMASGAYDSRDWGARSPASDQATTISSSAANVPVTTSQYTHAIPIFYGMNPAASILACGDSLTQGFGATGNIVGWTMRIAALSSSYTKQLTFMNLGTASQAHANSMAMVQALLSQTKTVETVGGVAQTISLKPRGCAFAAWSPNDSLSSQSVADVCWTNTLKSIDVCQRNGVVPIVWTSPPAAGMSAAAHTIRKTQNARVLALPDSVIKLDFCAVLADPSNVNQLLAAYNSGDDTHWNDAGYAAVAAYAAPILAASSL